MTTTMMINAIRGAVFAGITAALAISSCKGDATAIADADPKPADGSNDVFTCGEANDIGVGALCTYQGRECQRNYPGTQGLLCSCDVVGPSSPCACSRVCMDVPEECGSGALCCPVTFGSFSNRICVPMGCQQNGRCPVVDGGSSGGG